MKYIITASLILVGAISFAQSSKHTNQKKGVAIQGYDPVSYFNNKPTLGIEEISFSLENITYYFSSNENRELFKQNPEKYEPQYGGWCAYAMGVNGDKVKINPTTYKIFNDKLYLFYDFKGVNTLESWNEDEKNLLPKADTYWQKIIKGSR